MLRKDIIFSLLVPLVPSKAQPIMFIHGMSGFAAYLGDAMLYAAKLGFTCYAHDIIGHGDRDTENIQGKDIQHYVSDSSDFIERIILRKHHAQLVVVGHSMGGLIAAKLAETRDDVGHVVLVTPAPPKGVTFLPGGLSHLSFGDIFSLLGMALGGKSFVPSRQFLDSLFADPDASKGIVDIWEKRKFSCESLQTTLQLGFSQFPVDAEKISAPMLVIGAKKDALIHHSVAVNISRYFDAEVHIHAHLGHMCPFEHGWEENSRVIAEWIFRNQVR